MSFAYVLDIGNSLAKCALFDGDELSSMEKVPLDAIDHLQPFLSIHPAAPIIISSTAADDVRPSSDALGDRRVLQFDPSTPVPIAVDYPRSTLGLDRLANAVAAHSLSPMGSLVIDAGTCITYDYTISGIYQGGNISPGWAMRLKAMHEFTGRLPLLEAIPAQVYESKDTESAMKSGAFIGLLAEMDHIINEFKTRYEGMNVYLTGGDERILGERLENAIFAAPFLTLKGLHEILKHNN
jgi:type III pantothenate kinase